MTTLTDYEQRELDETFDEAEEVRRMERRPVMFVCPGCRTRAEGPAHSEQWCYCTPGGRRMRRES